MRAVFLGTPEFGLSILQTMVDSGIEVPLVITQPDRQQQRRGRGNATASTVGAWAVKHGLSVEKPAKITEATPAIIAAGADVAVVAAYGQLLPESVLETVNGRWLNVHGSLLPKYRGASPVQQAIMDGADETGVTIMQVVSKLDAGPIVNREPVPITPTDTAATLTKKVAAAGAQLLVDTLPRYLDGSITPRPQDDSASSMTKTLQKSDGTIDWSLEASQLERFVRAMQPWPGATTFFEEQPIAVLRAEVGDRGTNGTPGQFSAKAPLEVAAGKGSLKITRLRPAGKSAMDAAAWLRGLRRGGRFASV